MKKLLFIFILLNFSAAQAEIFKCTSPDGAVYFQDTPCVKGLTQSEVEIVPMDKEKIQQAKQKQEKELALWREQQQKIKADELKEREIRAQELNALTNQELANATRQQTQALENSNRATQYGQSGYWLYPHYYTHPYPQHPKHGKQEYKKSARQDKTAMDRLKIMVK